MGKLTAAAIVVVGAVVWTTSSSEPFTPPADADQTQAVAVKSMALLPAEPLFFFEDDTDALAQTTSAPQAPAAPASAAAAEMASLLPPQLPDFSPANQIPAANPTSVGQAIIEQIDRLEQDAGYELEQPTIESEPDADFTVAMLTDPAIKLEKAESADAESELTEVPVSVIDTDIPEADFQLVTVSSGDTLSGILNRHGLPSEQLNQLLKDDLVKEHLFDIDIGQELELTLDDEGLFKRLTTKVGNDLRVNIDRTHSGFDVTSVELPLERRRSVSSGMINNSLYLAAEQANLKQSTIMELAQIFQWELDFAREIRKGDKFSIVYDRLYREGEYIGDGDILAAEFVRGGRSYQAIRFTTSDGNTGYFSPDGKSKRRAFMRHPVDVVRITSKFNPSRLHPVLHQIRAHRGVDYGSPHGSPIYATADGKVIFSGDKNAYGKTVVLKHGKQFSTLYAHMSEISAKSKVGERVSQGDIIGYVGNTGRVTGTHLHYEFRVDGVQIDPLKVELPEAQPIDSAYLPELKNVADELIALMDESLQESDSYVATLATPID